MATENQLKLPTFEVDVNETTMYMVYQMSTNNDYLVAVNVTDPNLQNVYPISVYSGCDVTSLSQYNGTIYLLYQYKRSVNL